MDKNRKRGGRMNQAQVALVIRGLGNRGFDYSRVRKQGKNSKGIFINLSLKQRFWYSRGQISQERNPREQRGKPAGVNPTKLFFFGNKKFSFFRYQAWPLYSTQIFFICFKLSSLTPKIGKPVKSKFGRIDSRIQKSKRLTFISFSSH